MTPVYVNPLSGWTNHDSCIMTYLNHSLSIKLVWICWQSAHLCSKWETQWGMRSPAGSISSSQPLGLVWKLEIEGSCQSLFGSSAMFGVLGGLIYILLNESLVSTKGKLLKEARCWSYEVLKCVVLLIRYNLIPLIPYWCHSLVSDWGL